MPSKPAALVKSEAIVNIGNRAAQLVNALIQLDGIIKLGVPANPSNGTPAIAASEIATVIAPDVTAIISAAAAKYAETIVTADPVVPAEQEG
jgi:hypothetical protein